MDEERKKKFMEESFISPTLLNDLREWVSGGNRTIEIKLKNSEYSTDKALSIWAYDADLVTSEFVTSMDDIPSEKETLEKKLRYAEQDVAKLKKKLKEKE